MQLTPHPFQRLGAHAAAALSGRDHPADLINSDLDALVDTIAQAAGAAATAVKGGRYWAWQQKLAPMYPNSPPTAPRRAEFQAKGHEPAEQVRDLLGPDDTTDDDVCLACGAPAGVRWGKSLWPLTDSARYINNSPGRKGGYPACRQCRIALWCLPWAVAYGKGRITSIEGPEDIEARFVRRMTDLSTTALHQQWTDWSHAPDVWDTIADLLTDQPSDVTLNTWTNDNKAPQLKQRHIPYGPAHWLSRISARGYLPHLKALLQQAKGNPHLLHLVITDTGLDSWSAGASSGAESITRAVTTIWDEDDQAPSHARTPADHVQIYARIAFSRALADDEMDAVDTELAAFPAHHHKPWPVPLPR
ncbi:hypothetical protein [Streptomyces sp. 3N207]|uniref:hypothetical protein n=1 Tax=Streptomyces sp. 3N207 TaxID=3457417 RepID=UPI003FCF80FE